MWWMALRLAVLSLARNKLRAALTVLGILIGVAAVVAMTAIGEGAKESIERRFTDYAACKRKPGTSDLGIVFCQHLVQLIFIPSFRQKIPKLWHENVFQFSCSRLPVP